MSHWTFSLSTLRDERRRMRGRGVTHYLSRRIARSDVATRPRTRPPPRPTSLVTHPSRIRAFRVTAFDFRVVATPPPSTHLPHLARGAGPRATHARCFSRLSDATSSFDDAGAPRPGCWPLGYRRHDR